MHKPSKAIGVSTSSLTTEYLELQQITDATVSEHTAGNAASAELRTSAVLLAQHITEQVQIYGLNSEPVYIAGLFLGDRRIYSICLVSWKTGLAKRCYAPVLIATKTGGEGYVCFWNPKQPTAVWDAQNPPKIRMKGLPKRLIDYKMTGSITLANEEDLSIWAKDAIPFTEALHQREATRAQNLVAGVAAANHAITTF